MNNKTWNEFQQLCERLVKAKYFFNDPNVQEEHKKAQIVNLHNLSDLVDDCFKRLDDEHKEQAEKLLIDSVR